jgi:hypothetical protein
MVRTQFELGFWGVAERRTKKSRCVGAAVGAVRRAQRDFSKVSQLAELDAVVAETALLELELELFE